MVWLGRSGLDAIPHAPIPPVDTGALAGARSEAERAAATSGRVETLRDLRRTIIDWALSRYREAGLQPVYFGGALEPAEQRRDGIETLLDAATAYLLADVLPDEATTTLLARLDVYLGGPLFRPEREAS